MAHRNARRRLRVCALTVLFGCAPPETLSSTTCGGQVAYADADGDGAGDAARPVTDCPPPAGSVLDATDCDDRDAGIAPGGAEVCQDGVDQDCDGADARCDPVNVMADPNMLLGPADSSLGGSVATLNDGSALVVGSAQTPDTDCGAAYVWSGPVLGAQPVTAAARQLCGKSITNHTVFDGTVVASLGSDRVAVRDGEWQDVYMFVGEDPVMWYSYDEPRCMGFGSNLTGGEFTDDDVADILFSKPSCQEEHGLGGAVLVLSGNRVGDVIAGQEDIRINGPQGSTYFGGLAVAADGDGDGSDDIFVASEGGPGDIFLFRGPLHGVVSAEDADVTAPLGVACNSYSIAAAGDVDSDGRTDVAIGCFADAGGAMIYQTVTRQSFDAPLAVLTCAADEVCGLRVWSGFDVDDDDRADVAIDMIWWPDEASYARGVWLTSGPLAGTVEAESQGRVLTLGTIGVSSVAAVDLNGDGEMELALGTGFGTFSKDLRSSGAVIIVPSPELTDPL